MKRPEGVELKYPQQLNCPGPAKGRMKKRQIRLFSTQYSQREGGREKVCGQVPGTVKGTDRPLQPLPPFPVQSNPQTRILLPLPERK